MLLARGRLAAADGLDGGGVVGVDFYLLISIC